MRDAAAVPRPLATFFALTFGISWGIPGSALALSAWTGAFEVDLGEGSPLAWIAVWSPALSAFAVIAWLAGTRGLAAYVRRIVSFPGHWGWYAAVLVGVPGITFLAAAWTHAAGTPALVAPAVAPAAFLAMALGKAALGPVEELGWRGFALPLLQRRRSGLRAAVVLGLVWGLWHVPALFVQSLMTGAIEAGAVVSLLRLFVGITAKSVILTVLYNASGGSIALMFLYHWLGNLAWPWEADHGIFFLQDVFDVVIAAALFALVGRRWLARENLYTQVVPGGLRRPAG